MDDALSLLHSLSAQAVDLFPTNDPSTAAHVEEPEDSHISDLIARSAPKRPLNAYFEFRRFRAAEINKDENPKLSMTQLNDIITAEWAQLEPVAKHKYILLQKENQHKYEELKSKYDRSIYVRDELRTKCHPQHPSSVNGEILKSMMHDICNCWSKLGPRGQKKWLSRTRRDKLELLELVQQT